MKVGILTFHTALNFGAVLQTYALYHVLKDMGIDVEVIDYRAPFNEERFKPKSIKHYLKPRELYGLLFKNSYEIRDPKSFKNFRTSYLKMSSASAHDSKELEALCKRYDKIICGSDQIWNLGCTAGDDSFYLPFIEDTNKKNSYAASIGVTSLNEERSRLVRQYVSTFSHIAMREKDGTNLINDLLGKEKAVTVLDPTMLLSTKQWAEIADFSNIPSKPYLLIYLMSEDKKLLNYAARYAKDKGLKIVYITQRLFKRIQAEYRRNITPNEWIGLFLKADIIITNSFHGSAFAINFNKPVVIKLIPRSIANSRMLNLTDDLELDKLLFTDENIQSYQCKVDYSLANLKLHNLQAFSKKYLSEILK